MGRNANSDGDGLFRTRDLPLAAYLSLNGHEASHMERRGRIAFWVYNETPEVKSVIKSYGNGEVLLNVKDYLNCIADVRSDLYAYLGLD